MLHLPTSLRRKLPLIIGTTGLVLMVVGLFFNSENKSNKTNKSNLSNTVVISKPKIIKVDIAGAVEKPGLYEIPYDSRIQDVLISAGGLSPKANRNYISKSINLAQKATDGMKIYIPEESEASNLSSLSVLSDLSNLININVASLKDLDALSGIGPVTGQKIIDSRPYSATEELVSKKVISKSVYDKIKDKITAP